MFTLLLEQKYSFSDSLVLSAFGMAVVLCVLVAIMFCITIESKVFAMFGKKKAKITTDTPQMQTSVQAPAPVAAVRAAAPCEDYTVSLRDVSDKEAAMIMAIVADETGIPPQELVFRSIKPIKNK